MDSNCEKLLGLIKKKFDHQTKLKDYQWRLLHSREETAVASPDNAATTSVNIIEQIEQLEARLAALEGEIKKLTEKILQSPLCLIPLPHSNSPLLQYLFKARSMLDEIDDGISRIGSGSVDGILTQIDRAKEFLALPGGYSTLHNGLVLLFEAVVLSKNGAEEDALEQTKRARRFLPASDKPYRMVACLIQGNIASVSDRRFGGEQAYSEVVRELKKLYKAECERGNPCKAELYRMLKERLWQELERLRSWK